MKEEEHQRSWEEFVSRGLEAREALDNHQWLLGDLAIEVIKDYGKDTIGKYAYAIGVMKKTLQGYRTVSNRFPKEIRRKYRKLSFSHFRNVTSLEQPEAWLIQADDNDWSVEKLGVEIKSAYGDISDEGVPDPPPKVFRCPECNQWRLENVSYKEICKGHYVTVNDKLEYK